MKPLTLWQDADGRNLDRQDADPALSAAVKLRPSSRGHAGALSRSLPFFLASFAALYFGATRLGLIGSPYVDNSRPVHWLAALFLVAGGVYFMCGWSALWQASRNARAGTRV